MAKFIGFSIVCSGPPNFKIFRGPLGPGPVGPWVNASLPMTDTKIVRTDSISNTNITKINAFPDGSSLYSKCM